MIKERKYGIDDELIAKVGLRLSNTPVGTQSALQARVFELPDLENVFIMECDLYGNPIPEGSCFLAYYGRCGLIGRSMRVERLKNASSEDIKSMVQRFSEG